MMTPEYVANLVLRESCKHNKGNVMGHCQPCIAYRVKQALDEERERCAKIAANDNHPCGQFNCCGKVIAKAIRGTTE